MTARTTRQNGAPGFTLMELLVVLAIIAILAGLIIPNVQRSREQARTTHCRNNLHQFLVALNQFCEDQGENYIGISPGVGGWQPPGQSVYTLNEQGTLTWRPEEVYHTITSFEDDKADEEKMRYLTLFGKDFFITNQTVGLVANYIGGSRDSPEASVAFCPATYKTLDVFNTNSPNFKGYQVDPFLGNVQDWGGSTYGTTTHYDIYDRKNTKGDKIAFSDWNHIEGWNNKVGYDTFKWEFSNPRLGAFQGSSKGRLGCLTEVGFHHPGANGERGANVAFFDGRVEWLSTNVITNIYLWK